MCSGIGDYRTFTERPINPLNYKVVRVLTWDRVFPAVPYVHLPQTKNGNPRDVPLSPAALEILDRLPRDGALVFNLRESQVDALFRKAVKRAMVEDLHFHDSRREATSRMARKLDVMELARVTGHKDLRILHQVYYQPKVEDLAAKLRA